MSFAPTCRRCGHRELRGLSGATAIHRPEPGRHEIVFVCARCGGEAVDVVDRRRGPGAGGRRPRPTLPPAPSSPASAVVLVVGVPTRRSAAAARARLPPADPVDVLVVAERSPSMRSHPWVDRAVGPADYAPTVARRIVAGDRTHDVRVVTHGEAVAHVVALAAPTVVIATGPNPVARWHARRLRSQLRRATPPTTARGLRPAATPPPADPALS